MRKRTTWALFTLFLALATAVPSLAQAGAKEKPAVYTYVASWAVPRDQWPDMVKTDNADKPLLDKLVANGTLIGYGAYTNLIHQEGEPTHGTWFTATSEGNLLKALEAIYAQPGSTTAPVQGASHHWDQILTGTVYNWKPGSSAGYLSWSRWQVKPGEWHAFNELEKSVAVPVMEKLLADGTITAYGILSEDYHTQPLGVVYEYVTVPDAASMDKVNKAFDDMFTQNPSYADAFRAVAEREGHRDYLTLIRFMMNK